MNRHPCSGCGLRHCEGECFLADPPVEDEETISTLTLADLRKLYGEPFTQVESDPLKHLEPRKAA